MMKEVARYAEKAGVVVALEDWISAEDNLRLLDAIGSDYVGVYYDARNIKSRVHDPYGEPARLGKRINQIHVKNGPKLMRDKRHPGLAAPGAGVSRHRLSRLVRAGDRLADERSDRRHPRQHRVRAQHLQDAGDVGVGTCT